MLLKGYCPRQLPAGQGTTAEGCVGGPLEGSSPPKGAFSGPMGQAASCLHKCPLPHAGHVATKLQTAFPGLFPLKVTARLSCCQCNVSKNGGCNFCLICSKEIPALVPPPSSPLYLKKRTCSRQLFDPADRVTPQVMVKQ